MFLVSIYLCHLQAKLYRSEVMRKLVVIMMWFRNSGNGMVLYVKQEMVNNILHTLTLNTVFTAVFDLHVAHEIAV